MLLLASTAVAATVAVLDFWGPEVAAEDAAAAAEALRAALLASGVHDPMSGPDIADGVSAGREAQLRSARARYAEARRLYEEGQPGLAHLALVEAVDGLVAARSAVGRREELADAWYLDGLCALDLGDTVGARKDFAAALRLVPDYDRTRLAEAPSAVAPLFRAARQQVRTEAPPLPAREEIAAMATRLHVDFVVVGVVDADGQLALQVHDEAGTEVGELRARLGSLPPRATDPALGDLARKLEKAFEPALRSSPPPRAAAPVEAEVSEEGPPSIATRWWFWLAILGLAGGAGAAVALSLDPAEPGTTTTTPDSWSIHVELSN